MKPLATALAVGAAAFALLLSSAEPGHAGGRHWRHHHHHHHGWHGPRLGFGFYYNSYPRYYRPYPYYYYPPPRVTYTEPPVQWNNPDAVAGVPPGVRKDFFDPADCEMVREYQTQVTIDGKLVDAYGDACLQPDGTWKRGPAKLVPQ